MALTCKFGQAGQLALAQNIGKRDKFRSSYICTEHCGREKLSTEAEKCGRVMVTVCELV